MERADPIFKLRLPEHLRKKLEKEANAGRRSLTAEILQRLELSFSDVTERLNALEKEVFDPIRGNTALEEELDAMRAEVAPVSYGLEMTYLRRRPR